MKLNRQIDIYTRDIFKISSLRNSRINAKVIHEARVQARRLQAAFWIVEKIQGNSKPLLSLKKELKKTRHILGRCRLLDVAIKDARSFGWNVSSLEKQRKHDELSLKKYFTPDRVLTIQQNLNLISPRLGEMGKKNKKLAHLLRQKQRVEIDRIPQDKSDLHALRISLKKIRYRLEVLGVKNKHLQKIQHHLGRAHDYQVLARYFSPSPRLLKLEAKSLKTVQDLIGDYRKRI